jgi:hypothetical protein
MSLQLHRPDGEGGLEPRTVSEQNWRRQLRSPRWGSELRGGRLPDHRNTEMEPTSRARSLLFWLALGAATFVLLVAGYTSGFWGPVAPAESPSPAPAAIVSDLG